jgi:dihydroneopterin aldolase
MAIRSKLIEHVGYRILERIKSENPLVVRAGIRLRKLSPPINGNVADVAVVMEL